MNRLELLKKEKEAINNMECLSYDLVRECRKWYDKEIEAIEEFGAENPEYEDKE